MKKFLFLLSLVAAGSVSAQWSAPSKMIEIYSEGAQDHGIVNIKLDNLGPTHNCSKKDGLFRIVTNAERGKNQLSIALAAFAANFDVAVNISGEGCDSSGYQVISGIKTIK